MDPNLDPQRGAASAADGKGKSRPAYIVRKFKAKSRQQHQQAQSVSLIDWVQKLIAIKTNYVFSHLREGPAQDPEVVVQGAGIGRQLKKSR